MKRGIVLLLALAGALLAGCDDSPEEAQLRTAAKAAFTENDGRRACALFSDHYVKAVYGTRRNCRETMDSEFGPLDDVGLTRNAYVSDWSVDGDQGRIQVETNIDLDGTAVGHARFVRVDGAWLLDELERDLLTAQLESSFKLEGLTEAVPALAKPAVQSCFRKRWAALSDRDLRSYSYGLTGNKPRALRMNLEELNTCVPRDAEGRTGTRQVFEATLQAFAEGTGEDKKITECVLKRSRGISDEELLQFSIADDTEAAQQLQQLFAEIRRDCAGAVS